MLSGLGTGALLTRKPAKDHCSPWYLWLDTEYLGTSHRVVKYSTSDFLVILFLKDWAFMDWFTSTGSNSSPSLRGTMFLSTKSSQPPMGTMCIVDSQALGQAHLVFKSSAFLTKQGSWVGCRGILTQFTLFVPRVRDAIRLYVYIIICIRLYIYGGRNSGSPQNNCTPGKHESLFLLPFTLRTLPL